MVVARLTLICVASCRAYALSMSPRGTAVKFGSPSQKARSANAARTRRRKAEDLVAPIGANERLPLALGVVGEIAGRNQTAIVAHPVANAAGKLTFVEPGPPALRQRAIGFCQVPLLQHMP